MTLRVLIAVTHLLGAGHLTRAAALARAFLRRGHAVTLVSGGMPSPMLRLDDVEFVQLPPVRTVGTDFRNLLDASGGPVGPDHLSIRRDRLLAALKAARPQVVITELFPFGRRVLAGEFLGLLEAARVLKPRPLTVCSIRDILAAPGKPDRIEETHERLDRFYDLVLVHGDPDLVPLEASWPVTQRVRQIVRYTGYVDEDESVAPAPERGGIVVSGGSSAASAPLYRAAIEAARSIPDRPWRVLLGNGIDEDAFRAIRTSAPAHVTVERARPDFRALLSRAAVSVSQAGYNTVVDLLQARPASVLVPFEGGHETEQRLRAEEMEARGLAVVLPEMELSAARLAEAVRAALERTPPAIRVALNGAERSAEIVEAFGHGPPVLHARWDWAPLNRAVERARDAGWEPQFWWRDDDAVRQTPHLVRLLALAEHYRSPVAIAVIPRRSEASLVAALEASPMACALVHGLAHENHARAGDKKAEFGLQRPLGELRADAREALVTAQAKLGAKLVPVFVPPWNRIAPDLAPLLPRLGYGGLSAFRDRSGAGTLEGFVEVNTHIDPIDWHGSRSALPPGVLIEALAGAVRRRVVEQADRGEPIGLLSHHLVHDDALWFFLEALLEQIARLGLSFTAAERVFSCDGRIVAGL
jgi:predicted glycosyltransferase